MTERRAGMTEEPNGFDELNPYSKTGDDPLFHGYVINVMVRL